MPLPNLAHQAPILPLKLWRSAAFNGTALVIGSIAPDLDYVVAISPHVDRGAGHSVIGQFLVCLPVTLTLVLLIGYLRLGEVLAARLGPRVTWLADAATDVTRAGGFRRATLSALLGSFSHLAFDMLTHRLVPRWLAKRAIRLADLTFSPGTLTNVIASGLGALVSLWLLRRIALRTEGVAPKPRPGRAFVAILSLLGAVVGVLRARPAMRRPDDFFDAGRLYVWGYVAFLAACGAGAGLLLAGLILSSRDKATLSATTTSSKPLTGEGGDPLALEEETKARDARRA